MIAVTVEMVETIGAHCYRCYSTNTHPARHVGCLRCDDCGCVWLVTP